MKIALALLILPLAAFFIGCESTSGNSNSQGKVVSEPSGTAPSRSWPTAKIETGHSSTVNVLGQSGGYIIASKSGHPAKDDPHVLQATRKAQENPATPQDAKRAMTGDLNNDGFITLDEVVAMKQAGFDDKKIISLLESTDQVFNLTSEQEKFLRDRGVSQEVLSQAGKMNRVGGIKSSQSSLPSYPAGLSQ